MMKKRALCIIFSVFVMLLTILQPVFASEQEVLRSGLSYSEIGTAIEDFVAAHQDTTAGVAIAVFDQKDTIYEGYFGFANKEDGIAMDDQTVIEWGSVTKLTVWVSAMQLWEEGKLDLNEDIRVYLPEGFLKNLRYEKPITMLDLMNHTPGFEELVLGKDADDAESVLPLEEALSRYQPVQRFEPGVVQAYSNYGAALAGFIVERVSGQSYDVYVKEHIFEPLKMQHTAILPDLSDNQWVQTQRELVHSYRTDGSLISDGREYLNFYPCGMCTSTLKDLMAFGQALLNPDSPLFASAETYAEFFSPSAYCGDTDLPRDYHGIWTVIGIPNMVYHDGNNNGCSCALYLDMETATGMAVLSNQRFEKVYNELLPQRVFFNEEEGDTEVEYPYDSGYVEVSRNIWTGPLRLYRLFNLVPLSYVSNIVVETDNFGLRRYSYPSGDLLPVSQSEVILMYASVALWVLASLFSLIWLLIRLAGRLLRKKKSALGAWAIWSCVVQLPFPLLILPLAQSLINMEGWAIGVYRLCFFGAFLLCLAMVALFVYGILHCRKKKLTRKQKVLYVILMLNLLIAIWNILYWNLFMFWMVP